MKHVRSVKIRTLFIFFVLLGTSLANAQQMNDVGLNNPIPIHPGTTDKFPVVVIDSGVDYTHPDLAHLIYRNTILNELQIGPYKIIDDEFGWDFNENDSLSFDNVYSYTPQFTDVPEYNPKSDLATNLKDMGSSFFKNLMEVIIATVSVGSPGHGTHVSGIIVNHCESCAIVPLKIFGKEDLTIESLSSAIEYAHQRGYKLVNMSLGVDTKFFKDNLEQKEHLENAIKKIKDYKDILFVVAAGNDGAFLSELEHEVYPAMLDLPNVITVGSIDHDGKLASFSNYDPTYVDIFAPGVEIKSTWLEGGYEVLSGTSMSSPMVTGLVGSLWNQAQHQNKTAAEIKALFLSQRHRKQIKFKEFSPIAAPYVL